MLMCLSSLGGLLAEALQCTYTKIKCCTNKEHCDIAGQMECSEKNHEVGGILALFDGLIKC